MRKSPIIGDPSYLEARGWVEALRRLRSSWRTAWTPRIPPDPVEWIEGGGVILPAAIGAGGVGGRISFRSAPWWRLPIRWLVEDGVEVILLEIAAQCGKTTFGIGASAYCFNWLPGPQIYAMPTEDMAEELVRDRLRDIFKASPFAKGLKSDNLRLGGATIPGGGTLSVIGIGSPSALKMRPARIFIFDEYNEALKKNVNLGKPFERAKTRTRTYGSLRRVVAMSTPTEEGCGISELMESAKRYEWHCPCPHCGEFQRLEMGQVWWPRNKDGDASESPQNITTKDLARYQCAHCLELWTDSQRLNSVSKGKEVCLDPEKPNLIKGLPRMSTLYSPYVRISEMAGAFLSAANDPEAMKQFRNEWLAEPNSETLKTPSTDQGHLATLSFDGYEHPPSDWWRSEDPPRAPEFVRAITWGFDVQGSEVWGIARGWGDYGESIILWSGKFAGADDLDNAAYAYRREWIIQGGELVKPRRGFMDSGYRTHEVYRVCSRTPTLIPSKGRQDGTLPMVCSQVDRLDANRRTVGHVSLEILWTTYWQDQVEASLGAGPGRGRGVCHLPCNPPSELYRHLTAERKVKVRNRNGTISHAWKAHSHENHLRDCLVYSTAAAGHAKLLDMARKKPAPVESASIQSEQPAQIVAPVRKESALARLVKARNASNLSTSLNRFSEKRSS